MTEQQLQQAAVAIVLAIGEAIKEAGPEGIPSGHLYAVAMGHGMTLAQYEKIIAILVETGAVRKVGHLLVAEMG